MPPNERARSRAAAAPAEEERAGRVDPVAQPDAILADSDARQETREQSEGAVEHRTPTQDR